MNTPLSVTKRNIPFEAVKTTIRQRFNEHYNFNIKREILHFSTCKVCFELLYKLYTCTTVLVIHITIAKQD